MNSQPLQSLNFSIARSTTTLLVANGLEATPLIRTDAKLANIPIISLTALGMEGDRERCLAAGATAYLSKPVRLRQLAIKTAELLSSPQ